FRRVLESGAGGGSAARGLPLLVQCLPPLVIGLEARARIHAGGQTRRADDVEQRVLEAEEEAVAQAETVVTARLGYGRYLHVCVRVVAQDRRGLLGRIARARRFDGVRVACVRHGVLLLGSSVAGCGLMRVSQTGAPRTIRALIVACGCEPIACAPVRGVASSGGVGQESSAAGRAGLLRAVRGRAHRREHVWPASGA